MAKEEEVMVLNAEGQLVPREFGVDDGVKNYDTYEDAVDDLNAQALDIEHRALEYTWTIGRVAYLIREKSEYGSHDIDSFAKDLDKSPSTVYTAIKLYMTFTLQDIQRMRDEDIPLRKVNQLMRVDQGDRERIEEAMTDFRINDETLKQMIENSNNGVVMPDDPEGMRQYYEKCRDNGYKDAFDDEEEDDGEDEDDEDKAPASPGEKIVANMETDIDNMSLDISKLEQAVDGMMNVLAGDLWNSLDDETKASLNGRLSNLKEQLSKVMNKCWRLQRKLPGGATKEADSNEAQA